MAAPNHRQACIMRGHARFNREVRVLAASDNSAPLLQSLRELLSDALQIINGRADEDMKFCGHIVSLFPNVVAGFGSLVPASIPDRYFRPRRFPVTISFGGTISRFTRFAVNTPTSRIAETKTSLTSILPPESLSVEISARCALTREELRFVEIQPWHRQCRGSGTVALPQHARINRLLLNLRPMSR